MAAPAFGSAGTQFGGVDSTPNIDVPDSVAANDIIVVTMFIDDGATVTALPSGFAHAPDSPVAVSATDPSRSHSQAIVWKRASGAEDTSGTYDFTLSSSVYADGQAIRYTGAVTSGSPWDVTASATGAGSDTAWPAVSDTTTVADTLLIASSTNWSGGAWTPPAGFTERRDSGNQVITVVDKAQASAGATGSISGSCAGNDARTAWLGALKSTAGGTDATVSASTVAGTASVGAPTVKTGSTVTAVVVTGTGSVPAPTVKTGSTVTATTVAGTATVGSVTITSSAAPTPATVAGTATIGSPTVTTGTSVSPATVAGTASVGSPTVKTGSTVTAATVAVPATIPTPSVSAGGNANISATTVAAAATVGAPTVKTGSTVTATTVLGAVSIPAPTLSAAAFVIPGTLTPSQSRSLHTAAQSGSTLTASSSGSRLTAYQTPR